MEPEGRVSERKKRNSLIELIRFIFASVILLFHAGSDAGILNNIYHIGGLEVTFFKYGYLGVDYFFIVSGYLMAREAFNKSSKNNDYSKLGKETVDFLLKKIRSIMPIYLVACVLVSLYFLVNGKDSIFIVERLPSLLFIQRSGIVEKEFIGLAWYLSSMLLCMAILYPLLRKHNQIFSLIYGPLFGVLIIGYLINTTGSLSGVSDWIGVTYKCNYRAFAELSFGAACFEISRRIGERKWKNGKKFLFSLSATLFTLLSVAATLSANRIFNDGCILLCMCVFVTIFFGEVGFFSQTRALYNNKVFIYLGKLSMPMFLLQNVLHYWVSYVYQGRSIVLKISIVYLGTILLSVIVLYIRQRIVLLKLTQCGTLQ